MNREYADMIWCMARTNGGSPKARVVGAELRKARQENGVGVRELARRLGTTHSKLSRYENGQSIASSEFVASTLTALGVPEAERERVLDLARGRERTSWLAPFAPGWHQELTTLIEFERTASRIIELSTFIVPGLLQTSEYIRAVMADKPPGELDTLVTLRAGRREVLNGRSAPRFEALLMESVLRTRIGGSMVLAEQLRHISAMSAKRNVSVRVIADGCEWHPGHAGSYIMFDFSSSSPIVHLEHHNSLVFLHEQDDTGEYQEATDKLRCLAMGEAESVALIEEAAGTLEKQE